MFSTLPTIIAVFLFLVAAYALTAAVVAITRHRVLWARRAADISNVPLYAASCAVMAIAVVLEGIGTLQENSLVGLLGSLLLLTALAGTYWSRPRV